MSIKISAKNTETDNNFELNKNNEHNNNNKINPLKESKANDFINNLFVEEKIIFSEEDHKEFEKKQLSHKLNEELVDEFKNILFTQKEKFEKYVSNARIYDQKFLNLVDNIKTNAYESLNNEIKYKKLLEKIKLTEKNVSNLKLNMTNKDKTMNNAFNYLKKKLTNNNNYNFMKKSDFEENNGYYKELNETSDKIKKIDNNLNSLFNSFNKNEDNRNEINSIDVRNYKNNNFMKRNDNDDTIFIERNNNKNRIYIDQKDVNNIFSECYDGLYSLKCVQDEFDIKYNALKNKLITKINENNNI